MIPTPTESILGDSAILALPLLDNGRPFNPTGWHLIFTLKTSGTQPDSAALLQKDSNNGITITGTTALVELVPQDSATADPGLYVYDIQAQNIATSAVRTVCLGQHSFRRDVTRATTTSVPIFTTAPGVPGLIPVILRTEAQGPPDGSVPAQAIGQFSRVGDASPYDWYRWDGTIWEDLTAGGGEGTVTSVAISATGLSVSGSPVTTSGTITLAVLYGSAEGTACQGNDARLSDARTPTAHKSTHATGGSDALTPSDIGAAPTSRSITAGTGLTGGGDLSANRTLAVSYGTSAGTACEGNDARLSDARTPTAHKSTHATGGSDALTPSDIGAVATSALSTTATANSVVQRDSSGNLFGNVVSGAAGVFANSSAYGAIAMTVVGDPEDDGIPTLGVGNSVLRADGYLQVLGLEDLDSSAPTGGLVKSHSLELVIIFDPVEEVEENPSITLHTVGGGSVVIGPDSADTSNRTLTTPKASGIFAITSRTDGQIAPNAIVTEADSFNLSQATHWRKWIRLTKSSGTTTITLPTSGIDDGCAFEFFRAGAGDLAFSGGTVNGSARLADVPVNGAFGLVYLGSGTYDFV